MINNEIADLGFEFDWDKNTYRLQKEHYSFFITVLQGGGYMLFISTFENKNIVSIPIPEIEVFRVKSYLSMFDEIDKKITNLKMDVLHARNGY